MIAARREKSLVAANFRFMQPVNAHQKKCSQCHITHFQDGRAPYNSRRSDVLAKYVRLLVGPPFAKP